MANRLNADLYGKVVVLSPVFYAGPERARRFFCKSGFGCSPLAHGKKIIGYFLLDGEKARIEAYEIEKLSDDQSTEIDYPMTATS